MIIKNFDQSVKRNYNLNWSYIPDHIYRVLIIGCSGSGKANMLLNLIIYWNVRDPFERIYQLLTNGRKKITIRHEKNLKVFIDYSQTTDDTYGNLKGYNTAKKRKVLIAFDDLIADMKAKKISPTVSGTFMRDRNATFLLFSYHDYIMPKDKILNTWEYLTKENSNK